ncbi:MAG: hypothetical protein ACOYXB_05705 [Bacteroidota bacterium]
MSRSVTLLFGLMLLSGALFAQTQPADSADLLAAYREVNDYVDDNEACFKCHAEAKYHLTDKFFGRTITEKMCSDKIISREAYYTMVHKSFACTDCHSDEFGEFPHPLELRTEECYTCLDCHGYDDNYAQYHFEEIDEEVMASVHSTNNMEEFTCWKCHDPHSYQNFVRSDEKSMAEAIEYNNDICLSCHSDYSKFMLLTDKPQPDILAAHEWLPNQPQHFKSVRCIECHTQINDSVLVAHLVMPKADAVRNCTECHSKNSILMASLYKYRAKESRTKLGFVNGVILNDAYVIGATRNQYLGWAGVILFLLTLAGLSAHLVGRIIFKK